MAETQPPTRSSSSRGYLIAVTATAIWSTTGIFIGYLSTHYHLPSLILAFWRELFVAIGLWLGLRLFSPRQLILPNPRENLPFITLYGFVLAIFNALWTKSVALNGAAVGTVLAYSSPAFTALAGWQLFGERLNATKIIAVCLSIIGCALVSGAYNVTAWQVNPLGITVGLLAGLAFAAYSLLGKISSQRGIEAWTTMLYTFSIATLFLLLLQRPGEILWLGSSVAGWGTLILLAIGPTIGGYGLYTISLAYLPASVASLITTLEPPMTTVLAFFLLGEQMTGVQLAGSGLIMAGVFLLRTSEKALHPSTSSAKKAAKIATTNRWRHYPSTEENPFHVALTGLGKLERIPALAMPFLLATIAIAASLAFPQTDLRFTILRLRFHRTAVAAGQVYDLRFTPAMCVALVVWGFSLGDWFLLNLLPRVGRSYGPPQPPAILMSLARAIVALTFGVLAQVGLPLTWAVGLNLAAQATGTLLAIEAYWFCPHRLGVTRLRFHSPKLTATAPPLRVLHLADLHIERLTGRERTLIQKINDLHPDAILFSGDFLNLSCLNDPHAQADCRTFLSQLHAPLGVYVVTGSTLVDIPEAVQAVLEGMPVHRLDNERVTLAKNGQSLDVVGITCTHYPERDRPHLQALTTPSAKANRQRDRFCILLYHTPDLAPEAAQAGIDLQLSGHTHGGQVRLPLFGALVTSSLYGKRFEMGRYEVGPMTLYVSRGIGLEGMGAPRARFLCPPEVVLWEIGGAREE